VMAILCWAAKNSFHGRAAVNIHCALGLRN
jgi:hypothetical protein